MIILNTKIPCENCATAIKNSLKSISSIKKVDCSVEKSQVLIETFPETDENELKKIIIAEMMKSGRVCN